MISTAIGSLSAFRLAMVKDGTTVALESAVDKKECFSRNRSWNTENRIFMLKDFLLEEQGQSVMEYTLLMTLIGATAVVILTVMGMSISQITGVQITWDSYREWAYEKFSTK